VAEAAAKRGDAVAREPAVGLDLALTGPSRADAASQALQVGPQAPHAGEVVLQLGELDLELALRGVGVPGEDVEDDGRAIDDRQLELALEITLLARTELVVAGDQAGRGWAKIEAVSLYQRALDLMGSEEPEIRRKITQRLAVAAAASLHLMDVELLGRRSPQPADS